MWQDSLHWDILTGAADLKARVLKERRPGACSELPLPDLPVLPSYRGPGRSLLQREGKTRAAYWESKRHWSH
jgi:hypothetical protein